MTALRVSETFRSVQGEGVLAGTPSTFIRLAFCNLACSWCDAAYTWRGNVSYHEQQVDELLDYCTPLEHVVLTGGEPTLDDAAGELVAALRHRGHHLTVETNGTIFRDDWLGYVYLWSVSPKLGSSGQGPALSHDVVLGYLRRGYDTQLKFVVDGEDDFQAAVGFLRSLGDVSDEQVFMQPNGLCHNALVRPLLHGLRDVGSVVLTDGTPEPREATLDQQATVGVRLEVPYHDRYRWLCERVVRAQLDGELPCVVRAVTQQHKVAYGNRRGV